MKRKEKEIPGVLALVRERSSSFSKSESVVGDYLLNQPRSGSVLSISDLASSVGVSEATVVRFARKLDFDGFLDFKRALLEELLAKPEDTMLPEYEEVDVFDDSETVLAKLFALHKRTIDLTASVIEVDEFVRATSVLANATGVDFYGHGGSGYVLQSVVFQFLKTGIRCTAWVDESTQERSVKLLKNTDVVIALSHTGETSCVIQAVRLAKAVGVSVISITNVPDSTLAAASDIVLLTNVGHSLIGAEAGASRIAQLTILDALTVSVAVLRRQKERLFS